jgi:hypothetical protein
MKKSIPLNPLKMMILPSQARQLFCVKEGGNN